MVYLPSKGFWLVARGRSDLKVELVPCFGMAPRRSMTRAHGADQICQRAHVGLTVTRPIGDPLGRLRRLVGAGD